VALRSRFGWILFSTARVLRSFSPLSSSITRSDLNFALKFLFCLDMFMNPFFVTDFSISDSLKNFRKSVLIYETIIILFILIIDSFSLNYRITNQFVIIQIFHMHIYCTDLMIFISIIIIDTFCHITTRRIQISS